eukprot:g38253.t1
MSDKLTREVSPLIQSPTKHQTSPEKVGSSASTNEQDELGLRNARFYLYRSVDAAVVQSDEIEVAEWSSNNLAREPDGSATLSWRYYLFRLMLKMVTFWVIVVPLLPVAVTDMFFDRRLGAHSVIQWWFFLDKGPVVQRFWWNRMVASRDVGPLVSFYLLLYAGMWFCLTQVWVYNRVIAIWALRIFFFVTVLLMLVAVYRQSITHQNYVHTNFPSHAARPLNNHNWFAVLAAIYELFTLMTVVVRPEVPLVRNNIVYREFILNPLWQSIALRKEQVSYGLAIGIALCWLCICLFLYFQIDVRNTTDFIRYKRYRQLPPLVGLVTSSFFVFVVVNLLRAIKPEPEAWLSHLTPNKQRALAFTSVMLLIIYSVSAIVYWAWLNGKTDDFFVSQFMDFKLPAVHMMGEQLTKLLLAVATNMLDGEISPSISIITSTAFSILLCLQMLLQYWSMPCSVFGMNVFKLAIYAAIGWSALISLLAVNLYGDGSKVIEETWVPSVVLGVGWAIIAVWGIFFYYLKREAYRTQEGGLYCWGLQGTNASNGDERDWHIGKVPELVVLTDAIRPRTVSLGTTPFVIVVSMEGAVYSYGRNDRGQLGHGDYTYRYYLSHVTSLWNKGILARAVSCGSEHVLLLSEAGNVFSWGRADYGQLGLGHRKDLFGPTRVPLPCKARGIAAGELHSLVIADWELSLATEYDPTSETNRGRSTSTHKEAEHKKNAAAIYAFGLNTDGQLGVGLAYYNFDDSKWDSNTRKVWVKGEDDEYLCALSPVPVVGVEGFLEVVDAGLNHSLAVTSQGDLYVWGSQRRGQLGLGSGNFNGPENNIVEKPTLITMERVHGEVVEAVCGKFHTIFLTRQGRVYAMGANGQGQLGVGKEHPQLVKRTGRDNTNTMCAMSPLQVPFPEGVSVATVAAGSYTSGALTSNARFFTWGLGADYQHGNDSTENIFTPTQNQHFEKAIGYEGSLTFARGAGTEGAARKRQKRGGIVQLSMGAHLSVAISTSDQGKMAISGSSSIFTGLGSLKPPDIIWNVPTPISLPRSIERKFLNSLSEVDRKKKMQRRIQDRQTGLHFPPLGDFAIREGSLGADHGVVVLNNGQMIMLGGIAEDEDEEAAPEEDDTKAITVNSSDTDEGASPIRLNHRAVRTRRKHRHIAIRLPCPSPGRTVLTVSCGWWYTCLILDDYSLWTFGKGEFGQLGLGDCGKELNHDGKLEDLQVEEPQRVTEGLPAKSQVFAVSAGRFHTVILVRRPRTAADGKQINSPGDLSSRLTTMSTLRIDPSKDRLPGLLPPASPSSEDSTLRAPTPTDTMHQTAVDFSYDHAHGAETILRPSSTSTQEKQGAEAGPVVGGEPGGAARVATWTGNEADLVVEVFACGSDGHALDLMYQGQLPPGWGLLGMGSDSGVTAAETLNIEADKQGTDAAHSYTSTAEDLGGGGGATFSTMQKVDWKEIAGLGVPCDLSTGLTHSMLRTDKGALFSWGWNFFKCLGHGDQKTRWTPTHIKALEQYRIKTMACGLIHSTAVSEGGQLFTWGMGGHGALGHGSTEDEMLPKRVESVQRPVKDISAGTYQTCMLMDNGEVLITGSSLLGALGSGDVKRTVLTPRVVGPLLGRLNHGVEAGNHQLMAW